MKEIKTIKLIDTEFIVSIVDDYTEIKLSRKSKNDNLWEFLSSNTVFMLEKEYMLGEKE